MSIPQQDLTKFSEMVLFEGTPCSVAVLEDANFRSMFFRVYTIFSAIFFSAFFIFFKFYPSVKGIFFI